MNLSLEDAQILGTAISAGLIPFAVTWIKSVTWPDWLKFTLAVVLSAIAGTLTAYTAGQLLLTGTLIQNAAVIFMSSQGVYYIAFRGLGLERVLFPKSALAHEAENQAVQQVSTMSSAVASDALDPKTPATLNVVATVTS